MKILLVDVNCKHSSTGKIVYDLYEDLNSSGYTAAIAYGRGPLIKEDNIFKFGIDIETYIHALLTRLTGLTGMFSPFSTKRLLKFIKTFNPDIVHIHELHGYFANIATIINYLKKNNIHTVWTFHCEFMYTGKCGQAYGCEKWKHECFKCPQLREYPYSLLLDFTRKMHKDKKKLFTDFKDLTIVTPSKWLSDRVKQSFLKAANIQTIHNGIDTEKTFYPRDFQHLKLRHNLKNEKIILAVAPNLMSTQKGGMWVLKLAQRFKSHAAKFILIGVNDLKQKFDDNIIPLKRTSNQKELAEYYSMADVFIICSERENFPTTCLEAISCGTPIIGFDGGGTKETAPNGYGLFSNYGEIDKLEDILFSIINGEKQIYFRQDVADFGKINYSKSRMTLEYAKIYNQLK